MISLSYWYYIFPIGCSLYIYIYIYIYIASARLGAIFMGGHVSDTIRKGMMDVKLYDGDDGRVLIMVSNRKIHMLPQEGTTSCSPQEGTIDRAI